MNRNGNTVKRIAILTSSRADYGIYLPLLKAFRDDNSFQTCIIAFGSHNSRLYGLTINNILEDGFEVKYILKDVQKGDTPSDISAAIAETILLFSDFWNSHKTDFDIVFCLGDRYEMFAAVVAGIPFNISFAHIHGGERTMGAIDNVFRHAITLASRLHFTSCEEHARRVTELLESDKGVYNVGSLSIENIRNFTSLSIPEFNEKYHIDLTHPAILVTFHPETIALEKNILYADEMAHALSELKKYNFIITLPNADTYGSFIRDRFLDLQKTQGNIYCFENLGSSSYLTAMKFCSFMLGNTSSGIIEAASFGKWVINVGDRQKGRCHSGNILNVSVNCSEILCAAGRIEKNPLFFGENIFYKSNTAKQICDIIKKPE